MRRSWVAAVLLLALVSPVHAQGPEAWRAAAAGENPADADAVRTAAELLREIMAIPEQSVPPALLRSAQGVAIVPGVVKVGFVLGGRHGSGIVLVRDEKGGWGDPHRITLTGGSLGWQIGVQSTDVILVFKTRKSVDGLMGGKFTLGADASVAAGPVGRHAEAATDVQLKAEVYAYSRSRGLFAGIALEGSALQVGGRLQAPSALPPLKRLLDEASKR